jgi:hypothetical protein
MATSAPSSRVATSRSSHSGSGSQSASLTAITSWAEAATATLRPRAMFAPGSSIRVMASARRRVSSVPSVDPPSTTIISSGGRVWAEIARRNGSTRPPAFRTVVISETFTSPPARARTPGG